MSTPVYGRVSIEGIHAIALNRTGGVSRPPFDSLNLASYVGDDAKCVAANLDIAKELVSASKISIMNAEHGSKVHFVSESGMANPGDGLVTKQVGLALVALAADCVPFGLIDPVNRVIAVGHAGWRGVLANVMQSLLDEFVANGADLSHTQAVIGPAICAACYEVPTQRVELFRTVLPEAISSPRNLDLTAGVKSVLIGQVGEVHELTGCTFENPDMFSYRSAAGKPTGRGGLVIAISNSLNLES
ncbi:MAG: laccase domain-containing protein [Actinobacteria bacterium]|nr:laccase domain-containing protein [Actinomycetota bacterium]